jgi:siroheme synthase-like protein
VAYYPAFLDLRERAAVVVGGGEIARRKVAGLLHAGARVTVVAESGDPELRDLADRGRIALEARRYRSGDLRGFDLAIAATDDPSVHAAIAREAREENVWLNVVDVPEHCDFIAPALLERGPVQIAVGTSGAAPALAATLRDRIADLLGAEVEIVVEIHRRVRERLRTSEPSLAERSRILRALASAPLDEPVRAGDAAGIDRILHEVVGEHVSLAALDLTLPQTTESAR